VDSVVVNEKNCNLKTPAGGGGTDGSVCIAFKWYIKASLDCPAKLNN
jgi:hypothetical protein